MNLDGNGCTVNLDEANSMAVMTGWQVGGVFRGTFVLFLFFLA